MTKAKEELDQGAGFSRYHLLRSGIDLRILVSEPERGIRQIDELSFIFQQFTSGRLARSICETRGEPVAACPPQFRDTVIGRLHLATRAGQLLVEWIVQRVDLNITQNIERRRMPGHQRTMNGAPVLLEFPY